MKRAIALGHAIGIGFSGTAFAATVITNLAETELRDAAAAGGNIAFGGSGRIVLSEPITVTNRLSLEAPGLEVELSASRTNRLFIVEASGRLVLRNIVLTDGTATNGGAIYSAGALTVVDCVFRRNHALYTWSAEEAQVKAGQAAGGAIYSVGALAVSNCVFEANVAAGQAGWVRSYLYASSQGGMAKGGAIYASNTGSVREFLGTTFIDNHAFGGSGATDSHSASDGGPAFGGALYLEEGDAVVDGCRFRNNSAAAGTVGWHNSLGGADTSGGALYLKAGQLTTRLTQFERNLANGAYYYPARGGAVFNEAGTLVASQCLFIGNMAAGHAAGFEQSAGRAEGGALYSAGTTLLEGSTFVSNFASGGAGAIDEHGGRTGQRGLGGAISSSSVLSILNTTIVSNTAAGGSGSAQQYWPPSWYVSDAGDASGGGLHNQGSCYMTNCTLAWNQAQGGLGGRPPRPVPPGRDGQSLGGGVANLGSNWVQNTIFAENTLGSNIYGLVSDAGHNLSSDSTGLTASSSISGTVAGLGRLGYYGGPIPTLPLLSDSPARDQAATVPGLLEDQRGFARQVGAATDIGAVEMGPTDTSGFSLSLLNTSVTDNSLVLSWSSTRGVRLQKAGELPGSPWQDVPGSERTNNLALPFSGRAMFFRLVSGPKSSLPIPAPTGLVAWWSGDGNPLDLVGENHGVTYQTTYTNGLVGQAFQFSGTMQDRVTAPGTRLPSGNNDRTIEFWCRPENFGSLAGYRYSDYGAREYFLELRPSLSWVQDASPWLYAFPWARGLIAGVLPLQEWHHVAAVTEEGETRLYIDGDLAARGTIPFSSSASAVFCMGGFRGLLDEVCVYDRALTPAEIDAIYQAGSAGKIKPLR